jgi:hypothetical protein
MYSLSFAQGKARTPKFPAEQRAARYTKIMSKGLSLTPEQATQVQQITLTSAQKYDELLVKLNAIEKGPERKVIRQEIKANHQAHDQQVRDLLNDTQKPKYDKWLADHKVKAKARAKGKEVEDEYKEDGY